MNHLSVNAVVFCALCLVLSLAQPHNIGVNDFKRDHIIANYERRREQLKRLVEESKIKIEDHESGRHLLEDEEYNRLSKRIGLYERKIEKMEVPMEEREIDRIMERARMREQRRHSEL